MSYMHLTGDVTAITGTGISIWIHGHSIGIRTMIHSTILHGFRIITATMMHTIALVTDILMEGILPDCTILGTVDTTILQEALAAGTVSFQTDS